MNQIPKRIKTGIILPSDACESVTITFPDPSLYEIEKKIRIDPTCKTPETLKITIGDQVKITQMNDRLQEDFAVISGVTAGRQFHWKKSIDVSLPGNLEIGYTDNYLILTNDVPLEHYLACVAVSEMSANCPEAFLESQMISARSWVLANLRKKHPELGIDVCNDDCCQRYQGIAGLTSKAETIARQCAGKVLTYNGEIADARYSKSCGGVTEFGGNVWPGENLPYLQSILDGDPPYCGPDFIRDTDLSKYLGNVDESHSYFRWSKEISQGYLTDHVNALHHLEADCILGLENEKSGPSGRLLSCNLVFVDSAGAQRTHLLETEYTIRQTLDPSFLFSSAFTMTPSGENQTIPEKFNITGKGWGHGAGMCQIGALGMALSGKTSDEILKHYFPDTDLETL